MTDLAQAVDRVLNERFHLATIERATLDEPPPIAVKLRYCERLFPIRDEAKLPDAIAHQVVKRLKPGDDTVFWRVRPETNAGRCYFRFAVGKAS